MYKINKHMDTFTYKDKIYSYTKQSKNTYSFFSDNTKIMTVTATGSTHAIGKLVNFIDLSIK